MGRRGSGREMGKAHQAFVCCAALASLVGVSWPLPQEVLRSQGEEEEERSELLLAGQLGHGSAHQCREFLKHFGLVRLVGLGSLGTMNYGPVLTLLVGLGGIGTMNLFH